MGQRDWYLDAYKLRAEDAERQVEAMLAVIMENGLCPPSEQCGLCENGPTCEKHWRRWLFKVQRAGYATTEG